MFTIRCAPRTAVDDGVPGPRMGPCQTHLVRDFFPYQDHLFPRTASYLHTAGRVLHHQALLRQHPQPPSRLPEGVRVRLAPLHLRRCHAAPRLASRTQRRGQSPPAGYYVYSVLRPPRQPSPMRSRASASHCTTSRPPRHYRVSRYIIYPPSPVCNDKWDGKGDHLAMKRMPTRVPRPSGLGANNGAAQPGPPHDRTAPPALVLRPVLPSKRTGG